jgi:acetoin utilization protein AcuB
MRVSEAMTPRPMTIDPEAPVATAMAVMRERELRHLPVVDDAGRLVGVVTDRDLRSAVVAPALREYLSPEGRRWLERAGATLENLRVRNVMTSEAVTTTPEVPIEQAAAVMFERRVGCLPVVQHGQLVGIVTERDLLRALASALPAVKGSDPDSYLW